MELEEKEITIVCCYNNYDQFKNELLVSLNKQDCPYELIAIDNTNNTFSSCASAFNSVINQVKTPYVVFSHQDIVLTSEKQLGSFLTSVKSLSENSLLGVAGVRFSEKEIFSSIRHGKNATAAGKNYITELVKCDTIDECFFGGKTTLFKGFLFDEKVCNNWHMYAAELALHVLSNAGNVYVCPISLYHSSTGKLSKSFYQNFLSVCKKYHKQFPIIRTTCGYCKTSFLGRHFYYYYNLLRLSIKHIIG